MSYNFKVAVLLTCHNRKEKTIRLLTSLFSQSIQLNYDVYIVDDGSSDGTSQEISNKYPIVILIKGNGCLFWCGGMRLAWETASKHSDYDFYLCLNDDIIFNSNALESLFSDYDKLFDKYKDGFFIITGAFKDNKDIFTYGGWINNIPVIPSGKPSICTDINGNCLLVPRKVYKTIGCFSERFTHKFADIEYGLRIQAAGGTCWTTSLYMGECLRNKMPFEWCNPRIPIIKRLKYFYSPLGVCPKEDYYLRSKYNRPFWRPMIKAHLMTLFPKIWMKIKKISY